MGLGEWIGLIAANLFAVFYYVALLPPWREMYNRMFLTSVWMPLSFFDQLRWILDWGPVMFVLIAVFWAFISPARRQGVTWKEA